MRVTLVIDSLGRGGAQRVLTTMANYWATKGWSLTVVTLEGTASLAFALEPTVAIVPLGTTRPHRSPINRLLRKARHVPALRAAIRESEPDVVISFIDRINVLTLLAARGLSVPVIVSERTAPDAYAVGWTWKALRTWLYPGARALVAQTRAALGYFPHPAGRIDRAIPNPVLPPRGSGRAVVTRTDPMVLGMGRLGPEKGFDRLLEAFARLAAAFPDWRLEVWGEGSERPALEALRRRLGLERSVTLPGLTDAPGDVMRQASLFVLSSRFEGFPNVLGEAMACGLPVVSFDCPYGPGEIVRHGIDGLLVPPAGGASALAEALARLMGDPAERGRLAARAPEVLERFDVERILSLWGDLLADLGLPAEGRSPDPLQRSRAHGGYESAGARGTRSPHD